MGEIRRGSWASPAARGVVLMRSLMHVPCWDFVAVLSCRSVPCSVSCYFAAKPYSPSFVAAPLLFLVHGFHRCSSAFF